MSLKTWQEGVESGIEKLLSGEPSEDNAKLLSALYIIRDRINSPVGKRTDIVCGSLVDELLQDMLSAFVAYADKKTEYQKTPSGAIHAELLKSFDAMLDLQRQIFRMLWQDCDTEGERERIGKFFSVFPQNAKE